jgi:hypothetical protein
MLHHRELTPELSRAERDGWEPVLPAYPEVSTKLRHGVGLNDLLGGQEAGEGEVMVDFPKTEAQMPERALRTFRWPSPKRPHLELANRPKGNCSHRSQQARRMHCVSAQTNATEAQMGRERVRRAMQTEADSLAATRNRLPNAFLPPNA